MKPTILVIEDDPTAVRLLELTLSREGYQVLGASDGLEGLKLAHSQPVDLILLDLMLPGLDGFAVLDQLQYAPRTTDIPVLVISAKSQFTDKAMAAKSGADAYLTKPYTNEDLLDSVRSLLSKRLQIAARGNCVLLLGSHGSVVTHVTLCTGLALASKGEMTTVVDLYPFSVEHSRLLGVPARPAPISLSDPKTTKQLSGLMVRHPSGLCLLNNLGGSGEAGQLTPEDARAVLGTLLTEGGFVLVDLPLHAADVLRHIADYCALVLLVIWGHPASLAAARSALTLIEQAGIEPERISIVPVGESEQERIAELERAALGLASAESGPNAPAFQAIADRLQSMKQPHEGSTRHAT